MIMESIDSLEFCDSVLKETIKIIELNFFFSHLKWLKKRRLHMFVDKLRFSILLQSTLIVLRLINLNHL